MEGVIGGEAGKSGHSFYGVIHVSYVFQGRLVGDTHTVPSEVKLSLCCMVLGKRERHGSNDCNDGHY